jgi:hypothetical protein
VSAPGFSGFRENYAKQKMIIVLAEPELFVNPLSCQQETTNKKRT